MLNRNAWSAHELSRRLLVRLVDAFVPDGEPVVMGLDDSIERRWGTRIKKRGIYRDPVRSSKGHFVKASGLRWLSFALLPEIRWAGRCWALPFLAVLAPSQRYWETHRPDKRPFKRLTDWARQGLLQTARWLPHRRIVAVADSSFAAIELLEAVRHRVTVVTRLRLDARRSAMRRRLVLPASAGGRAWSETASPRCSSASITRARDGAACG